MRILVTGASGFIGKHIATALANHPVEVTLVTRDTTHQCKETATLKTVTLDIYDTNKNIFKLLGKPDVLIHLAWGGLPDYNSLHHFEHELPKQYIFLKQLVESGLQSLIVTGTCFEYGMLPGKLNEAMPTHPANPYGLAKDTLRQQLLYLQKTVPFSLAWARLFYLHGENQAAHSLFSQLRNAVTQGDKIFNMSGGEQLRDYLPVEKAAEYITALALHGNNPGIINICSGIPISVRTLVENWITTHHWNIALNPGYYPYPDYEPMAFWGDSSKLEKYLRKHA